MKRGEIYFIKRRDRFNVGGEIPKARPGVIVSSDTLNNNSDVVMVVYLTTHPARSLPTHVCIHATGTPSTALCEQIDHVSTQLLGNYCGTCTEEELAAIERGMVKALDMEFRIDPTMNKAEPQELSEGEKWMMKEVGKLQAERDRYAKVIDRLLEVGQA